MLILGLDPGSICTGYGLIVPAGRSLEWRASGCLRPPRAAGLPERLHALHEGLLRLLAQHTPDVAALETAFVGRHPRPALVLGQARGALIVGLLSAQVPLFEYAPRLVKLSVTGVGGASKPQVERMVRHLIRGVPERLTPDEADALAVAVCHAHRLGRTALDVALPGAAGGAS